MLSLSTDLLVFCRPETVTLGLEYDLKERTIWGQEFSVRDTAGVQARKRQGNVCMEWEAGLVAETEGRNDWEVGNFPETQPQDDLEFEACD